MGRRGTAARFDAGRVLVVAVLLALSALVCSTGAIAKKHRRASGGTTKVAAVLPAAQVEISPGLCMPVDTPLCTNAAQDQVHIYSQSCSAVGGFEGRQLQPGTTCGIDLTAFMDPSFGFTKPNCVTTHTQTSDRATAFGRPVNAVTVGGVSRKIELSYPFALLSSRTATGWMDGPDGNRNPVGDHRLVFSIQVRPHQGAPPVCFTQPITGGDVTAVMHITDVP
jgi:hypothetical protein